MLLSPQPHSEKCREQGNLVPSQKHTIKTVKYSLKWHIYIQKLKLSKTLTQHKQQQRYEKLHIPLQINTFQNTQLHYKNPTITTLPVPICLEMGKVQLLSGLPL
jgi:hypothetical protein